MIGKSEWTPAGRSSNSECGCFFILYKKFWEKNLTRTLGFDKLFKRMIIIINTDDLHKNKLNSDVVLEILAFG